MSNISHFLIANRAFSSFYFSGMPFLDGLRRVNVFIGPNNSGKSRLLRSMSKGNLIGFPNNSGEVVAEPLLRIQRSLDVLSQHEISELRQKITQLRGNSRHVNEIIGTINEVIYKIRKWGEENPERTDLQDTISELSHLESTFTKTCNKQLDENIERIYIPTLRGLRRLHSLTNNGSENIDPYATLTRTEYFSDKKPGQSSPIIYTGYNFFDDLTDLLLSSQQDRELVARFQDFLSNEFFSGMKTTLIPHKKEATVWVRIGNDEYPIHELGDGIQQVILITFPIFSRPGRAKLLFIEEPELFMHPGLQRKLLDTFLNNDAFSKCQVFLTTHSNHLIDLSYEVDEVSIFYISKKLDATYHTDSAKHFEIERMDFRQRKFLDSLGVRSSSVWHVNATIWVEGISDRIYLRKFLSLLLENDASTEIREDLDFSFLEYGGANLTHYDMARSEEETSNINVERICSNALFIADRDEGKSKKHQKFRDRFGDNYYVLSCREIENSLPIEVILNVVSAWINYPILHDNTVEINTLQRKIGKLVEAFLNPSERSKISGIFDEKGNIKDKRRFADEACSRLTNWIQLPEPAKQLARLLHQHVSTHSKLLG